MTVGQIVEQVAVGQSTVSAHLKILTEARFVLVEPRGTARLYRVNQQCIDCFPSAADSATPAGGQAGPMSTPDAEAHVEQVRQRYAAAARSPAAGRGTGLAAGPADAERFGLAHYDTYADALPSGIGATSLGCGNSVEGADLRTGETVLDLGSGGGLSADMGAVGVATTTTRVSTRHTTQIKPATALRNLAPHEPPRPSKTAGQQPYRGFTCSYLCGPWGSLLQPKTAARSPGEADPQAARPHRARSPTH